MNDERNPQANTSGGPPRDMRGNAPPKDDPHPELEKLAWMVGVWKADAFYPSGGSGPGGKGSGTFTCHRKLEGHAIVLEVAAQGPFQWFEGQLIFTWSHRLGQARGNYIDNFGITEQCEVSWTDSEAIMAFPRFWKGETFTQRYTLTRIDANTFRYHLEINQGQQGFKTLIDIQCTRQAKAPGAQDAGAQPSPQIGPQLTPDRQLMRLEAGKYVSRALGVAAELGIADHLHGGPKPVAELARLTGTNPDALYRLLRGLTSVGVFEAQPERSFSNNPLSHFLRSEVEGSQRALIQWVNDPAVWLPWGRIDHSVRTGKPAIEAVFGKDLFSWLKEHPSSLAAFQGAMKELSGSTGRGIASSYDFSSIERLVDVGGGQGALLSLILERFPNVKGVLFDRPEVVTVAREALNKSGLANRIEIAEGSFLDGVPGPVDACILKFVIHNWDDENCVKILSHCRKALKPGGRVLIADMVLSDAPEAAFAKLLDLEMLALTPGGRERTEAEFSSLLERAGLKLKRIVPTGSLVSILETFAA